MNKELVLNNQTEIGAVGIIFTLVNYATCDNAEIMVQTDKITETIRGLNFVHEEDYFFNVPTSFFTEHDGNMQQLYDFIGQADINKAYIDDEGNITVILVTGEVINIERF